MVVLNRIYTRTGDDGTTSLGSGARRKKYDLRVAAYGTLDEVNAVIGVARLHTAGSDLDATLARVQNDLFDVEAEIDRLNAELTPLTSFVLPGGTPAAAALHLARTICRRAERMIVELADQPDEIVSPPAVKYVNRLSDFLFVASRYVNHKGAGDVLWVPGQNR